MQLVSVAEDRLAKDRRLNFEDDTQQFRVTSKYFEHWMHNPEPASRTFLHDHGGSGCALPFELPTGVSFVVLKFMVSLTIDVPMDRFRFFAGDKPIDTFEEYDALPRDQVVCIKRL